MHAKAVHVTDKDVLVLDTAKYPFFWEQCCDCGLIHKVHVSVKGKKVYLRHERRAAGPKSSEVCCADIISEPTMARILGRSGGRKSRRKITKAQQRKMQLARKKKRTETTDRSADK